MSQALQLVILGSLSIDVCRPWTATSGLIFSILECFDAITFVTASHRVVQQDLSTLRSKNAPKKKTLDSWLLSMALERLCL